MLIRFSQNIKWATVKFWLLRNVKFYSKYPALQCIWGCQVVQANQEQAASKGISHQLSLEESSEHGQLWDINDPCAQRIHCRICKMISVYCQPFSTVQDVHLLVEVNYSYQLRISIDRYFQAIISSVVGLSVKINIGAALVSVHAHTEHVQQSYVPSHVG